MFRKILYPTDFSDVASKALGYIKQLKDAGAQQVIILHVINQRIIDGLRRHAILDKDILQWQEKAKEIAEGSLAEMSKALENIGFTVKPVITTGFPWREILEMEEKENPSLIVIGSHGRSNLRDMFLGAVSDRVIRKSKGPVMVIKRDPED